MNILRTFAIIATISVAAYFFVRPLQVFSNKQWLVSHIFIIGGLSFLTGWLWLNSDQFANFDGIGMLVGGMWSMAGGLCFMTAYALRNRAGGRQG